MRPSGLTEAAAVPGTGKAGCHTGSGNFQELKGATDSDSAVVHTECQWQAIGTSDSESSSSWQNFACSMHAAVARRSESGPGRLCSSSESGRHSELWITGIAC
jgi:hypothetical protein